MHQGLVCVPLCYPRRIGRTAILLILALIFIAGIANAAPPEEARARLSRGRQLYGEGDYTSARSELTKAYELAPIYKLLYEIAQCDRQLGDYVAAIRHLEKYLRDGSAMDAATRATAEKELASLRTHVGNVTIKVNVPDAQLTVDDESVGNVTTEPVLMNPGRHKLWASKAGYYPASKELVAEAAQNVELALDLKAIPPPRRSLSARITGSTGGRVALVAIPLAVIAAAIARSRRRRSSAPAPAPAPAKTVEEVEPTPAHVVPLVHDPDAAPPSKRFVLDSAVKQDIGKVKPTNQDSYLLEERHGIFAIADGVGGQAGGEVASAMAVRAIKQCFDAGGVKVGLLTHVPPPAAQLATAVYAANHAIRVRQAADWNVSEMATTCVVARFCPDAGRLYIAHIGDSRAYRLRGGQIEQMTNDHTMAELGVVGPRANHLSRVLGSEPCPKIDLLLAQPLAGDVYLLCSDGLTKMMNLEQLAGILRGAASANQAVASLVDLANAQGGQDNITVVVIRVMGT